ncbi:DUF3146 family protein [Synechococcus sp. O70.2]|jgi:hypothetical protein|uniref:DUF3146 family protein n=1 Tax=unclassified Synechococcus TaxID=2626047 RepID=UPI0039C38A7C
MSQLPQTTAHVQITRRSWQEGAIEGEVSANGWVWHFCWRFRGGGLRVEPSVGRALICDPLSRFLEKSDYLLEPGSNYSFVIRSRL